ncbi:MULTISPECIES: lipid-transfer protein [Marinobacter]|jgi:acetyl-CoA acetyltransferase|uniref:propanoyl-CoA C-acyltransferase n=1 Tax=Marinobacter vinifirmus TaxID=355591 RepID=A0A7Z1DR74_9GAMM|nr:MULTISPECIES: lipid-transfer protein [Marinobacter]MAO14457.1 lipid-transfer protein [Marinobacter sp.]OZC34500.1 lipid-transfer protein [Marinobacter vinifirmus]WBU39898.1 lipid-transfer protein [Marinobacter alkaliphilus]|tara:strand:- start:70 stop:1254 length:1185 start_codon:yes stop_codon:yes gene_type:complete
MAAFIAGTSLVPFAKPGLSEMYDRMGSDALFLALNDAGLSLKHLDQAYVGYVYGDSTSGQRAVYRVGMTGIPIINVNNNCASGSTALFLARQAVESGVADCVLALGFEQMKPGALEQVFSDRPSPLEKFEMIADEAFFDKRDLPVTLKLFGGAGKAHMDLYGTKLETFARIRAKASDHAFNNPQALFRKKVSTEEVLHDQSIWPGVMTKMMACPPTCGASAAVVVSERFALKHGLDATVRIRSQAMVSDLQDTFEGPDMIKLVGAGLTELAAEKVYEQAGVAPEDIDVIELHDCFAQNELITYEALGLCSPGEGERLVEDGDNTYGGKFVTNPSGGLLSKGHPLGATGLAQCFELTQQLRGNAGARQVDNARFGLQHNLGLGSAAVVTLYERTR